MDFYGDSLCSCKRLNVSELFFFFSSRRRHTRSLRDWSSDVCSSDLGAVWVPTNFRLMPDEVAWLATASGAKAFVCHGDFPDHASAVNAASAALAFIWRIGEGAFGEISLSEAIAAHAGHDIEEARVEYDDPCWFFFTSGTTGRSKAAVLTHGQMAFVVTNHLADLLPGTT